MKSVLMIVAVAAVLPLPVSAADKPLTENTGRAILQELRNIRQLLEKQQLPAPAPHAAPAKPEIVKVRSGGDHVLGKKDAPLTMIEFTDYQCPYCKRFHDTTFPDLRKNFIDTGKVRFISRNLPLGFHPFAQKAAEAAFCAGDQGKYWEMRDALFRNQPRLGIEAIRGYAKELSLKDGPFKRCLDDGKYAAAVKDEAAQAGSIGVTGTPTFVLGTEQGGSVEGKKIVGALPYAAFASQINALLVAAGKK